MSDDRTTDPNQPAGSSDASADASGVPVSPYAPPTGDPSPGASPFDGGDAVSSDGAPSASGTAPEAPAAPAPAPGAAPEAPYGSAPAAPAYGAPATPPYDVAGDATSTSGAPAYGAPAYGAPAYDAPSDAPAYNQATAAYGAPAYGYGYAAARTNTLAIVSFIASLAGVFVLPVIGQIAGVVMGHISLSQIKSRGEKGRGLALSGVISGYATLALGVLAIIAFAIFIGALASAPGSRYS